MTAQGNTIPTSEMLRMFTCIMIYDLMNGLPFDYNVDIQAPSIHDYQDDIRHAISACRLPDIKMLDERS